MDGVPPGLRLYDDRRGSAYSLETASLVRREEEELVFDNRPAHAEAKLVPTKCGLLHTCLVQEKVVGIGGIVAKVFPYCAMQRVSARLGHQVYGTAGAVAVLRRHVQAQLLEFFDRILNRHVYGAAAQSLVRHTVDQKPIEIFADAVDHRVVTVFKVSARYAQRTRAHLHQIEHVAAVQG